MLAASAFWAVLTVGVLVGSASGAYAADGAVTTPATPVEVGSGETRAVPGFALSGTTTSPVTILVESNNGTIGIPVSSGVVVAPGGTPTRVSLTGSEADLNAALDGLTYTRSTPEADTITVSVLGTNQFQCAATGHTYEVVDGAYTWDSAFSAAAARFTAHGYLATVTSASENSCIHAGVNAYTGDGRNAWIGARLVPGGQDSDWEWASGPEAGTVFWTGGLAGSVVDGQYADWDRVDVQPQSDLGQACGQYYNSDPGQPTWHDNGCAAGNKYVVEVEEVFAELPTGSVAVSALPAPSPAITVAVSASPSGPGPYSVGQQVVFSFVATNTGDVTLTGLTVDTTAFTGSGTAPSITCPSEASSLAPGASVTCSATYTLTQADIDRGVTSSTANASATPPDGPSVTSDPSTATVTATPAPAITVVTTADRTSITAAGQIVNYRYLITNTGNVTLTALTFSGRTFTGTGPLPEITCPVGSLGALASGQSVVCTASYTVVSADLTGKPLSSTTTVTGTTPAGASVVSTSNGTPAITSAVLTASSVASALVATGISDLPMGLGIASGLLMLGTVLLLVSRRRPIR